MATDRETLLLGRVEVSPTSLGLSVVGYKISALVDRELAGEAETDESGRFALKVKLAAKPARVVVRATSPDGLPAGSILVDGDGVDLRFSAVSRPDPSVPSTQRGVISSPGPLLTRDAVDQFHAAVGVATAAGLYPKTWGPVPGFSSFYELSDQLERALQFARGTVAGDSSSVRALRALLADVACCCPAHDQPEEPDQEPPARGRSPNANGELGAENIKPERDYPPALDPTDAYVLSVAGSLLDRIFQGQNKDGHTWGDRSQDFFVRAAETIERLVAIARQVNAHKVHPAELVKAIGADASEHGASHSHSHGDGEVEGRTDRHSATQGHHAGGRDANDLLHLEGHYDTLEELGLRPVLEAYEEHTLSDSVATWLRLARRIGQAVDAELTPRDIPIVLNEPKQISVPAGKRVSIALEPVEAAVIPALPAGQKSGVLAFGTEGRLSAPVRQKRNAVSLTLAKDTPAGPLIVAWAPPEPTLAERVRDWIADQDGEIIARWIPIDTIGGQWCIDVVDRREVIELTARGDPELAWAQRLVGGPSAQTVQDIFIVEACTALTLEWRVATRGACRGGRVGAVRLFADDILIADDLTATGTRSVVADRPIEYRIEALVQLPGESAPAPHVKAILIDRYRRVHLDVPTGVLPPRTRSAAHVRLSCPAGRGGVNVAIGSSDEVILPRTAVRVAEGSDRATAYLTPPGPHAGRVRLTATATRHESGSASVQVGYVGQPAPNALGRFDIASRSPRTVGIHMAMLHTGKVLVFSYREDPWPVTSTDYTNIFALGRSDAASCELWDPATGATTEVPLRRNLFCSGHSFLGDGRLFVAGGQFYLPVWILDILAPPLVAALRAGFEHARGDFGGAAADRHSFDPVAGAWQRAEDLREARWYPTVATMDDGSVMVLSGTNGPLSQALLGWGIRDSYEVYDADGHLRHSAPHPFHIYHLYPFAHHLPTGELLVHSKRTTHLYDRSADAWRTLPGGTAWPVSRTSSGSGTSVLLPLQPERDRRTGAVTYPPGRVMLVGGGGVEGASEPEQPADYAAGRLTRRIPATNTTEILDFAEGRNPGWRRAADMAHPRVLPDAVLLPDGKVCVVHGARLGGSAGFARHTDPNTGADQAVYEAELYDPATNTWQTGAPSNEGFERFYHATAMLLPDGRVLIAGHDGFLNMPPDDGSVYDLELYSPPYLFQGRRPVIRRGPEECRYGGVFSVASDTSAFAVGSVCLIRQGSVTHHVNTDQRYVGLAFDAVGPNELRVFAPPNGNVAPPGHYMLFLVDRRGVPSVARWIRVGQ